MVLPHTHLLICNRGYEVMGWSVQKIATVGRYLPSAGVNNCKGSSSRLKVYDAKGCMDSQTLRDYLGFLQTQETTTNLQLHELSLLATTVLRG